ncbi:hypothetical protein [Ottowia sp.]|nr:hypothetical protein [Ottowia sp.]HRN75564.1 hypothetical protein [Ottowia sp.]HRQ02384.1 hypothetical protein [Ottowia sp.]
MTPHFGNRHASEETSMNQMTRSLRTLSAKPSDEPLESRLKK